MKRFWKKLLSLTLALLVLAGCWTEFAAIAETAAHPAWNQARAESIPSENDSLRLQAKSKKKKSTATPQVTASPTPKAEEATLAPAGPTATPEPEGPITDPQSIADYLFSHNMQLPENFITKKQAQALGWDSRSNYVSDVAPGKSIGGDYFGNYEGILPTGKGITYHEADCYYTGGRRNAYRVIYSTEGRVWFTADHYNTFTELFPTVP